MGGELRQIDRLRAKQTMKGLTALSVGMKDGQKQEFEARLDLFPLGTHLPSLCVTTV